VNETTRADAERGHGAAAPSKLHATSDDIRGVRSRRDVEDQSRDDEEPEIVNAEHRNQPLSRAAANWNRTIKKT
jgi:hypothetical protein